MNTYQYRADDSMKTVQGYPVGNNHGLSLFVWKEMKGKLPVWRVCEQTSGMILNGAACAPTRKEAIAGAIESLDRLSPEAMTRLKRTIMEKSLDKRPGESPAGV